MSLWALDNANMLLNHFNLRRLTVCLFYVDAQLCGKLCASHYPRQNKYTTSTVSPLLSGCPWIWKGHEVKL